MKRRQFLNYSALSTIPMMLNGLKLQAMPFNAFAPFVNPDNDRVLVLIQCNGGYDGLNMVIPTEYYDQLAKVRENILIPKDKIIPIHDKTGFHPAMSPLANLMKDGHLNVIQGVGYPDQNRSHFRSTDIWTSASASNEYVSSGWLGRLFDENYPGYPENYPNAEFPDPFAIAISSNISATCQGQTTNYSLAINDPFNIVPLTVSSGGVEVDTYYGHELAFLRESIIQTNQYAAVIEKAAGKGKTTATYPDTSLGAQLKNIALLIGGGLKTKVYIANIGGFDTHANQSQGADPTQGEMATLLSNLSASIAAFQADLQQQGLAERVVGMTFTEFGRRIWSNFSLGTDHGDCAPLFIFGQCVLGGLTGVNPVIKNEVPTNEGVAMQHDFRRVYGSILRHWLETPPETVDSILKGHFVDLPLVAGCAITTAHYELISASGIKVYPNPAKEEITMTFTSTGDKTQVNILDLLGRVIKTKKYESHSAGVQQWSMSLQGFAAGTYVVRINQGRHMLSQKLQIL